MRWCSIRLAIIVGTVACGSAAGGETLTTATGYRLQYDVRAPAGAELPVALIFMHGKNGAHDTPAMKTLAGKVADAGVRVYLPSMPWSRR